MTKREYSIFAQLSKAPAAPEIDLREGAFSPTLSSAPDGISAVIPKGRTTTAARVSLI